MNRRSTANVTDLSQDLFAQVLVFAVAFFLLSVDSLAAFGVSIAL